MEQIQFAIELDKASPPATMLVTFLVRGQVVQLVKKLPSKGFNGITKIG